MLVLPSEALEWARENNVETANALLATIPSQGSLTDSQSSERPTFELQLTHPDSGTVYQISPVTPLETQRIPVSARPGDGVQLAQLTLWVDGELIATFSEPLPAASALWTLEPGTHTFIARGVDQNGRELASPPVTITVLP
jgi:hypothetical protein